MKVLKVKGKEAVIIDVTVDTNGYVSNDGVRWNTYAGSEFLSRNKNREKIYATGCDYVRDKHPEFFTGSIDVDWSCIIRGAMNHHKINQNQLSLITGISVAHLNALRKGTRKNPSFNMGLAIFKLHPNKEELLK